MAYKQEKFISHSSGVWKVQDKALADSEADESLLPDAMFAVCPHMLEGAKELCRVFFIRPLIPFMRVLPS